MKYYFSDCVDQGEKSALTSALATLNEIDVVGLAEAYEESLCALFWFWKLRDPFDEYCRSGKRFPLKLARSRLGTSGAAQLDLDHAQSSYTLAITDELNLYNQSRSLFWKRMDLVGVTPPPEKVVLAAPSNETRNKDRVAPATMVHFLRIPKSASTSLLLDMDLAIDANASACRNLVVHRDHEFVADELRGYNKNNTVSFVVLREPCERFESIYDHLKKVLPDEDSLRLTQSAAEWGQMLLNTSALQNSFLYHGDTAALYHHRVAWQQTAYVLPGMTEIVCLSSARDDVQVRIFNKHLPGCTLPSRLRKVNAAERAHTNVDPKACRIASALYPEDVKLWGSNCAGS
jgi:hypothetical protein